MTWFCSIVHCLAHFSLDDLVAHPEGAHPLAVDANAGVALLDLHLLVFARRWRSSLYESVQIGGLKSLHYGSEQLFS